MIKTLRCLIFLAFLLLSFAASAKDLYVSSVAYTAVVQWAALTTYAVGNCRRQLAAPAVNAERVFCASAISTGISGAAEPTWNLGNAATTADAGVTWTERTGNASFQQQGGVTNTWTAPAARIGDLTTTTGTSVLASGDRVFLSSDHAESTSLGEYRIQGGTSLSPISYISVNRTTGNIPPLAADITTGGSVTDPGGIIDFDGFHIINGISWIASTNIYLGDFVGGTLIFENSTLSHSAASTGTFQIGSSVVLDNTVLNSLYFNLISGTPVFVEWRNTPLGYTGNAPTTLFATNGNTIADVNVHNVDMSGAGAATITSGDPKRMLINLTQCKLGSGYTLPTSFGDNGDPAYLNIIDCDSANTNYNNARVAYGGALTTETTITRTGGATDKVQAVSHKIVTDSQSKGLPNPQFTSFPIPIWNTSTGSALTATIEIISSGTLNNNDIWSQCDGLTSSSTASGSSINNYPATPLTAAVAVTSSSAAWNATPATPVTQKLNIALTPQKVGLIWCVVKVAKNSTTLYVDPLITLH